MQLYVLCAGERKPRKGQNRIKTGQKGKRDEAGKSQKQLQSIKKEKLKKIQKEGRKVQTHSSFIKRKKKKGAEMQLTQSYKERDQNCQLNIQEMEDLKQQYLDELKRLSNLEYFDEIKIAELTENLNDEVIKSSVEDLIPIPSESEGIPEHMCDVPFHDNSLPLDVSNDQIEDFSESNNEVSSIDDDSFSIDNIDYVEASPLDFELVSSEVMEIVIPEVEISSGSTTTLSDIFLSEYDSFIFDFAHEEFADELASQHISTG
nr:hypothetical protein [Tanacetum cinerariifolium]